MHPFLFISRFTSQRRAAFFGGGAGGKQKRLAAANCLPAKESATAQEVKLEDKQREPRETGINFHLPLPLTTSRPADRLARCKW